MEPELYRSIVWVRTLVDALERRDIAREELFRGTNVSPSLLGNSRARVSLQDWDALVQRAMALTNEPGLGISIVSAASDHLHHIVGPITAACGSLREAESMFERYVPLLGNAKRFDLVEEGKRAYFSYTSFSVAPRHPEFEAELSLGLIYRSALRFARRDDNDADEVWFTHAAPEYASRYAEAFRCPVRFGRPRNAILFPRACLDTRHVHGNPVLLDVLRDGAERLLAEQGTPSLPERVRAILLHEVDLRRVTAARVAYLLKLDARALRVQLIKANTSWSHVRDQARCRIACRELQRGERRLGELGARLGFSNQSAFCRAFKRWMGVTPSKYVHDLAAHRHTDASP